MSNYLKDLEDSRLLFKTFCDGLMYGMFFYHGKTLHRVTSIEGLDETVNGVYLIKECKPCLRSISDMTKDEAEELFRILDIKEDKGEWLKINDVGIIRLFTQLGKDFFEISDAMDYLNSIHIDYRGLIPIGLALEAPKRVYK